MQGAKTNEEDGGNQGISMLDTMEMLKARPIGNSLL